MVAVMHWLRPLLDQHRHQPTVRQRDGDDRRVPFMAPFLNPFLTPILCAFDPLRGPFLGSLSLVYPTLVVLGHRIPFIAKIALVVKNN